MLNTVEKNGSNSHSDVSAAARPKFVRQAWTKISSQDIKTYCKAHKLSYSQLGKFFGVSENAVNNWANNRNAPSEAVQEKFLEMSTGSKPTSPKKKSGGRKPETWSVISLDDVKSYQEHHKLSTSDFAKLIGYSRQGLVNLLQGISAPTVESQKKIQKRLTNATPPVASAAPIPVSKPKKSSKKNKSKKRPPVAKKPKPSNFKTVTATVNVAADSPNVSYLDVISAYIKTPGYQKANLTPTQLVNFLEKMKKLLS